MLGIETTYPTVAGNFGFKTDEVVASTTDEVAPETIVIDSIEKVEPVDSESKSWPYLALFALITVVAGGVLYRP